MHKFSEMIEKCIFRAAQNKKLKIIEPAISPFRWWFFLESTQQEYETLPLVEARVQGVPRRRY